MSTTIKMMDIVRYDKSINNYKLFDFSYNFYDNDLKPFFEEKFKQHFLLYEIAFDTIGLFKNRLQTKLNEIYPYYREMYKTEIAYQGMDLLVTKDIVDTYIRETTSNSNTSNTSTSESNSTSSSNNLATAHETPQNQTLDLDRFMTGANKESLSSNNNSTDNNSSNSESENNIVEKYTYSSKGNMGVSSDGFLLEKWREIIINIDMMIMEELKELFLLIY